MFFTDKSEANAFANNIAIKMKEHGFRIVPFIKNTTTADDRSGYSVIGHLLWSMESDDEDERIISFVSKEKAEKEIKKFYKDLKDANSIFKISATIV